MATRRRFGWRALITDIANRLLRRVGIHNIERVFILTDCSPSGPLTAELLTAEQLNAFRQRGQIDCTEQAIADVEHGRKICIGVTENDFLCGYTWYSLQAYRHSGSNYAFFDARFICGYGAFIHPDYRGRQLRAAIVARAVDFAQSIGRLGILAAIDWTNFGSLRSALKIGYRPCGWSYRCPWLDLGIDKARYHLRQLAGPDLVGSVFIGNAITQVTEVAYRQSLLCLLVDSAGPAHHPALRERLKRWLGLSVSKAEWARRRGIPYLRFSREQETEMAQHIANLDTDLLISYGAPILGDAMLQAPRRAAINVHPSLLPDYRGGSPMLWQMLREESVTGATVHLLSQGIDQGAILAQVKSDLPRGLHRDQAFELARRNAAQVLSQWLARFSGSGAIDASPQPRQSATPFARNMSLATLNEQIDWPNAVPGMLFALARYLGRWPAELMPPPGLAQWLPWRASGYDLQPGNQTSVRWHLRPFGLHFSNRHGSIRLRPILHPLRWLSHLRHWRRLHAEKGKNVYL